MNNSNNIRFVTGMWIVVGMLLCVIGCKNSSGVSEYAGLAHQGKKCPSSINSIEWDTLYIGA